jgi:hypothetical protein
LRKEEIRKRIESIFTFLFLDPYVEENSDDDDCKRGECNEIDEGEIQHMENNQEQNSQENEG